MRLEPLYSVSFSYPEAHMVELAGAAGTESQHFFIAEGRVEGAISGRFRGANHPRRRTDLTYCPDFQGVIVTEDGAKIMFDLRGYGRAYPELRRQVVGTVTHLSGDERYARLNDVVCVLTGEVQSGEGPDGSTLIVLDVAELVWEPLADAPVRSLR